VLARVSSRGRSICTWRSELVQPLWCTRRTRGR
jgi:hypothetical protein